MILAPPAVLPSRPCIPRSGVSRYGSLSRRFLGLPFAAGDERGFRGGGGMEGRAPPVAIPAQESASCIRSTKEGPNGMRGAEESKGLIELERWVGGWGQGTVTAGNRGPQAT